MAMTMQSWRYASVVSIVSALVCLTGCEKSQLLAPTNSTITLSAPTRVLPAGGSTEVTAVVVEQSGTPVQNGTTVRFSTSLGSVDPVEVQTRNGVATTTFLAGNNSGVAEIRGISGGATGGTSTTGTGTAATTGTANVILITIGAAAVNTVSLRANPGSVGPSGGTVELIASVVGETGRLLEGILVTFNANQGVLSSPTALTNTSGEARVSLTTNVETKVTATAGTKSSTPETTITVRPGPAISVTCAPGSGTGTCGAVQASTTGNTATVVFTVTRPTTTPASSTLSSVSISFGDGTSQALGNLASGTTTVAHTYNGPSGQVPATYTAIVQATDINGETTSASASVSVTPRPIPTPISVNLTATEGTKTLTSARWAFSATATGGGEGTSNAPIESYAWDFGDGSTVTTSGNQTSHIYTVPGDKTVTVTVRTQDGRTASAREEITVTFLPPPTPTPTP